MLYRKIAKYCIFILYPAAWLKTFFSYKYWWSLLSLKFRSMFYVNRDNLTFSFPICNLYLVPLILAPTKTSNRTSKDNVESG